MPTPSLTYGQIRRWDGFIQVGLGFVLVFGWLLLSVVTVWLTGRRRVVFLWPIAIVWALICCGYLCVGIDGYMSDLITFQQMLAPPPGTPGPGWGY